MSSAQKIDFKIAAGKKKGAGLNFEDAKNLIHRLQELLKSAGDKTIPHLRVKGQEDETSAAEILDLIDARLEIEDISVRITAQQRRLPLNDRWEALKRAYNEWRQNHSLPDAES